MLRVVIPARRASTSMVISSPLGPDGPDGADSFAAVVAPKVVPRPDM
jgi:hypothetical protein